MATSAFAQNATVTANLKQLSGSASQPTGASIRVDLQNCTAPRVPGTGNIGEKTRTFYPNGSGIVTVTLYSNSVIDCGQGVLANPVNFYTFNLVSNGGVTSLGSYKVPPGSSTLDTLTPINATPIINTPTGDSTYLRLDLGNFSDLVQPVPFWSVSGLINTNTGYRLNGTAPVNHLLCGNGTAYVDATTCGNIGVISFNTRTGAVTLLSADVLTALGYTPARTDGANATGTWPISVTGNAGTASALDHSPSTCSAGSYSRGIAANGNASGCTALPGIPIAQSAQIAGCTANGSANTYATCGPTTITWGVAFADANYDTECNGFNPDDNAGNTYPACDPSHCPVGSVRVYSQTASTVTFMVISERQRDFHPQFVRCTATHF